jgi:hypothetical protein
MKFLKFLLITVITLLVVFIGMVVFSNKILTELTKSKDSEFENLKFSIATREVKFDNYVLNGENLGKGTAKINIKKTLENGILSNKVYFSNLTLEDVDLDAINANSDKFIDSYVDSLEVPQTELEKAQVKSADFLLDKESKKAQLIMDTDGMITSKITPAIANVDKLKKEFTEIKDFSSKASKVKEINDSIKPLSKQIFDQKKQLQDLVMNIENERDIMLENTSGDLRHLDVELKMNDIANIGNYVFVDKGQEIKENTNKLLKELKIIRSISKLSKQDISEVTINKNQVVAKTNKQKLDNIIINLGKGAENNVQVSTVNEKEVYNINYKNTDLVMNMIYKESEKIESEIKYIKANFLSKDGNKDMSLDQKLIFDGQKLVKENKTALTEPQKLEITEKIKTLTETRYNEIVSNYSDQTLKIEEILKSLQTKITELDNLYFNLLKLQGVSAVTQETNPIVEAGKAK